MDDLLATKSEDVGLIVRVISFQDFQPMWSWSTYVTDGQTVKQTTCDSKTTLCTVVHRAVISTVTQKQLNDLQSEDYMYKKLCRCWGTTRRATNAKYHTWKG